MIYGDLGIPPDWGRGDNFDVVGLVATAIGFVITFRQVRKAVKVSEATSRALDTAKRANILLLLPQFRLLETELDWGLSMKEGGREFTGRVLASYTHLANEVASLLETHSLADEPLVADLRASAMQAGDAKNTIFSTQQSLRKVTEEFRKHIPQLAAKVSALNATQQATSIAQEAAP